MLRIMNIFGMWSVNDSSLCLWNMNEIIVDIYLAFGFFIPYDIWDMWGDPIHKSLNGQIGHAFTDYKNVSNL